MVLVCDGQRMHIIPLSKVRRTVEQGRTTDTGNTCTHQLVPGVCLPPDTVVAIRYQLQVGRRLGDDWVARILLPGDQVIAAGRETCALVLSRSASVDDGRRSIVVDRRTRPAAVGIRSAWCWCERNRQMPPVHQIFAGGMSPMDGVMDRGGGVVLIKEVVRRAPLDEAIRVVHPVGRREEVVARAVAIAS